MLDREITFDRFIRWVLLALGVTAAVLLISRLSSVLLPFAIAWILAYMLYPFVVFLQKTCRLRSRVLSITVAMLAVVALLVLGLYLIVPPLIEETFRVAGLLTGYFQDNFVTTSVLSSLEKLQAKYATNDSLLQLMQQNSFVEVLQSITQQLWTLVSGTVDFAIGLVSSLIVVLYMFFILMDYEKIAGEWRHFIPAGKRDFAGQVVSDVKNGMNAYFRGQSLIAFCVGVLCSIGFLIIGFPMAIGLGLLIGVLNLVPYLQLVGLVPLTLLAIIEAAETGESFWVLQLSALAVIGVVQVIQDFYLTPRIMGKVMGLKPAVILLSLSVWGSLLGLIGLIIALPLTTLLLSYYRRFILGETDESPQNGPIEEKK